MDCIWGPHHISIMPTRCNACVAVHKGHTEVTLDIDLDSMKHKGSLFLVLHISHSYKGKFKYQQSYFIIFLCEKMVGSLILEKIMNGIHIKKSLITLI